MATPHKVFICHSSEDKTRFVIPFAQALFAKGVDAWVDQFEIQAGDSLVSKIFNEGIGNASAVIAVISRSSVSKPWVKAEIDVAFVRRIEGKCKLIPIVLDYAVVPTALSAIRWEKIEDVSNFKSALDRVLLSIFDQYQKPPIGAAPSFANNVTAAIPNLATLDSRVLIECCQASVKEDKLLIENTFFLDIERKLGISGEILDQSMGILQNLGFVKIESIDDGTITGCMPQAAGFDHYLRATDPQYDNHFLQVVARIVNNNDRSGTAIMEASDLPARVIYHFVSQLSSQRHLSFIDNSQYGCDKFKITTVNASLQRLLESGN